MKAIKNTKSFKLQHTYSSLQTKGSWSRLDTKDDKTRQRTEYTETAREYYKRNSSMEGFNLPSKNWMDGFYNFQIILSPALDIYPTNKKNNRLYSPVRNN
jgi:hypothetical protein